MKNFVKRTLDWELINENPTVFKVEKINKQAETKDYVIKSVERILADRVEEQEEDILAHSFANDKVEISDYSDEEKKELDELMEKVYLIDEQIEKNTPIYNYIELWKFMIWYRHLSPRLKVHFKKIYEELIELGSTQKIEQLINSPFNNWSYDVKNITFHINSLLEIKPDFNFSIFNNKELDKMVKNAKKLTNN